MNIIDSDRNSTMIAENTFANIIQQVQSSNLNFQLQLSPFSAMISLKKTPVKDKSGLLKNVAPKTVCSAADQNEVASLLARNTELKNEFIVWQIWSYWSRE